ncbi:hypothetical protein STEG23_021863, partial [Scotinomys teguina]
MHCQWSLECCRSLLKRKKDPYSLATVLSADTKQGQGDLSFSSFEDEARLSTENKQHYIAH